MAAGDMAGADDKRRECQADGNASAEWLSFGEDRRDREKRDGGISKVRVM
jgi:hypothetical protein